MVRLAFIMVLDGITNGNIAIPAVRMMHASVREENTNARAPFSRRDVSTVSSGSMEGRTADSQATEIAAERGTLLEGHVARRLTPAMVRDYDLILAMELEHIEQVTAIAPEARGKMMLFGHWTGRKEIPDPYRKNRDAFEYVYGLLEQASLEWAKRLS